MRAIQQRLPKFKRAPEALPRRQLTATSLAILNLLARYQVLPTSLLRRLAPSSKNITNSHLQLLFHRGLVNRFSFPRVGNPGEFHYYLDNPAVMALVERTGDRALAAVIKRNREKRYADVHDLSKVEEMQGKLLFLKHEVMISRFHAMLELACSVSDDKVALERFRQGPTLWHSVEVPKIERDPEHGTFIEMDSTERRALRPDAFFTLRFLSEPEGRNRAHFFYEADRQTEGTRQITDKLRAYFQYILKQRRHEEHFGIKRVRAVLIDTVSSDWSKRLQEAAAHPPMSGPKPSALFWFGSSTELDGKGPSSIFERIWKPAAESSLRSLMD
jgi:protein involved in plasmid replication-relaxation